MLAAALPSGRSDETRGDASYPTRAHRRGESSKRRWGKHDFDEKKPWMEVWRRAVSREPNEFWDKESKTPAMLIRLHLKTIGQEVDGDAPIENVSNYKPSAFTSAPASSPPVAPEDFKARTPPRPKGQGAVQAAGRKRPVEDEFPWDANRRRKRLCYDFQIGCCSESHAGTSVCPEDSSLRHQCAKCLDFGHGAANCNNTSKYNKGGGGGGAGSGKGGGGKNKGKGGKGGRGGGRGQQNQGGGGGWRNGWNSW